MSLVFNSLEASQIKNLPEESRVCSKSMFSFMWSTNAAAETARRGMYTRHMNTEAERRGGDERESRIQTTSTPCAGFTGSMVRCRVER